MFAHLQQNYELPDLTRNLTINGPNQLWEGDVINVGIASGSVSLTTIRDAWTSEILNYMIVEEFQPHHALSVVDGALAIHPTSDCILHAHYRGFGALPQYKELPRKYGIRLSFGSALNIRRVTLMHYLNVHQVVHAHREFIMDVRRTIATVIQLGTAPG